MIAYCPSLTHVDHWLTGYETVEKYAIQAVKTEGYFLHFLWDPVAFGDENMFLYLLIHTTDVGSDTT